MQTNNSTSVIEWEYEVQDFYGEYLPKIYLEGFGHNGWELCLAQVISDPVAEVGGTKHYFLIFKRPKSPSIS